MKKPVITLKEAWSNTTAVQGTTWDPTVGRSPFNVMTGAGFLEDLITGKKSEEEMQHKAPKQLPFPLDRSIEQMAVVYQDIVKLKITMTSAMKDGLLSTAERHILRQKVKELQEMMDNLKVMSYEIERMHL